MGVDSRFHLQDSLYQFPYHYLPHVDAKGVPRRGRYLKWGFEYLCYQAHLVEMALSEPVSSVLEVGCGDGFFVGALGSAVRTRVGIDLSDSAIRFAKAFHPNVQFTVQPIVEVAEAFDLVAAIEVLEHIPDAEVLPFLAACWNRVLPGGRLLLCVPTSVVACHSKHYRHYDLSMLTRSLEDAGIGNDMESHDFVYGPPKVLEAFLKLTCNRLVTIEIAAVNAAIWKYLWRTRRTDEARGRHLAVVVRRSTSHSAVARR